MRASKMGLPDELQRKLNVPGLRHDRGLQTSSPRGRPVRIKQLRRARAKKGQRWPKVGVVQDVEKLRSKLDAEALRNLGDQEVLIHREVEIEQTWTINAIAAGVPDEIRACARDAGIRISGTRRAKAEGHALRSDLRSRHWQREGIVIDVTQEDSIRIAFEIVVHRIFSGNAIGKRELVPTSILYTQRVSADERSRGNSTVHLGNSTHFPSAQ